MNASFTLLRQEIRLRLRGSAGPAALGLFILAGALAPLSLGTNDDLLATVAPGLLWIFACLAALLGLEGLFQDDLSEGRFAVLRLTSLPLWLVMLLMMLAYWIVVCAPVLIAAIPIGFLLGADISTTLRLSLSLGVGTPALAFIGACLAAICAGLPRGTGLVIFLALPFFAPALIFGARAATGGDDMIAAFMFLSAFSLIALATCPFIAAAAIRQNME
ncbi:MAG: heme exporter protein CcmB [Aquisalinus sp.]|nr:heme exporter protein CcmB [Aquisalinus sp.]